MVKVEKSNKRLFGKAANFFSKIGEKIKLKKSKKNQIMEEIQEILVMEA